MDKGKLVCNFCDYNPVVIAELLKSKSIPPKDKYHCNFKITDGEIFAEETARKTCPNLTEAPPLSLSAVYKFDDEEWNEKYKQLSKKIVLQHTDISKPPPWLNIGKNECPYFLRARG